VIKCGENEIGRYVELVGEMRNPYTIVVGKSDW
jgi:hypothetical protein